MTPPVPPPDLPQPTDDEDPAGEPLPTTGAGAAVAGMAAIATVTALRRRAHQPKGHPGDS